MRNFATLSDRPMPKIALPTYVPDFRYLNTPPPFSKYLKDYNEEHLYPSCVYTAGLPNDSTTLNEPIHNTLNETGSLRLRGILIDTIADVLPVATSPNIVWGSKDLWSREGIPNWAPQNSSKPYALGGTLEHAFKHTIAAGLKYDEYGHPIGRVKSIEDHPDDILLSSAPEYSASDPRIFCQNRTIAYTCKGYMCLAPRWAKAGFEVWLLIGGQVFYLMRKCGEDEDRIFLGECYVHGLMDGEALGWLRDGRAKVETVVIT